MKSNKKHFFPENEKLGGFVLHVRMHQNKGRHRTNTRMYVLHVSAGSKLKAAIFAIYYRNMSIIQMTLSFCGFVYC